MQDKKSRSNSFFSRVLDTFQERISQVVLTFGLGLGPNPKLIDKTGIGSGSLSNGGPSGSSTKLVYTVNSPVSVSAGDKN
jgi:hypothetical protein